MSLKNRFIQRDISPIYKYTIANVNLRDDKSTSANILTVIPKNSRVEVLDTEDEWSKVIYNSQTGYVYRDYLSTSKYTWSNLNLREESNTNSKVIAIIPKNSRVEVLEVNDEWSKVVYQGEVGYVFNYFLSNDGNKPGMIDYKYFYTDINRFVNDNDIKSPTNYLLVTDLKNKYTYVFKKYNNMWKQLYKWKSTVGKPKTPTITGIFYIDGRKPGFGTDDYRVKYATRIKGGYYYHSVLYDPTGSYLIDGRLGMALSHGCVRLDTDNAEWIYINIPDTTAVLIH